MTGENMVELKIQIVRNSFLCIASSLLIEIEKIVNPLMSMCQFNTRPLTREIVEGPSRYLSLERRKRRKTRSKSSILRVPPNSCFLLLR